MGRISLLKEAEIKEFDQPLELTLEQREAVFTIQELTTNKLQFRKVESKIGFIIQTGYFLINKKFFIPSATILN